MHAACWCSPHKVCSLKYVHRSQQTEEHRKMLPSVVSCLLSHNYMRWKRIWPSHKSRIWPSHKSQCTLTYPCEVQCSFPQLVLRRWGTGSQQWSTQGTTPLLQGVHIGVWFGRASWMKGLSQGSTPQAMRWKDNVNKVLLLTTSGLITWLHSTIKCTHEDQRLFWFSENSDTSWKVHCGVS